MIFNFKNIQKNNTTYIIAEIGVNHECSVKVAKKLISLAKKGGADAAKFQTYKAEKIVKKNSKAYWDLKKEKTQSQFELFSKLDKFQPKDYKNLALYCKKLKIDFLSTPFDLESVSFLNPLVPLFKISSSDITNIPLIKKIANCRKPIILSTGASNIEEIKSAIKILKKGTKKIIIMHCILNYPTKDWNANLSMITDLKKNFPQYIIGYSDHTLPDTNMLNLTTAYLLGAKVIEKHFTHNKKLKGNDHYHSMDVEDLKNLSKNITHINKILGKIG
ncbi:N-acetylneuraminate synthase family protein, partial [Pelagibacterales bacterium SAG-MED05]|nr:N-acetylneuraminate synthase family protein [Pelagibacterales bacterium SAG-MED05]